MERELKVLGQDPARLLLRLELSGLLTVEQRANVDRWLETLDASLFHLDVDTQKLILKPDMSDLDLIGKSGELRLAAERLSARAQDPKDPSRQAASLALTRLFAWSMESRGSKNP